MKQRRTPFLVALRCLIPAMLALLSSCDNNMVDVDISGEWDLYITDVENFNNINRYKTKTKCVIPGDWIWVLQENPDYTSCIWLVKEITIPDAYNEQSLVLNLGRIALSDRAFFNGKEIGGTGYLPKKETPLDYGFGLNNYRKYFIPSSIVKYGNTNTVAIQVFSHIFSGFPDAPSITTLQNWEQHHRLSDFIPILQNFGVIIINLILFMLIVHTVQKEKRYPFLLYPFCLLIISTYIHFLIMGAPLLGNGLLRYKLILVLLILNALFASLILLGPMNRREKIFFYIFLSSVIIAIPVIIYTPDTGFLIKVSIFCFIGFMVMCTVFVCIPLLYRLHKYSLAYYTLLIIIPFCMLIWNTFYHIFTLSVYRIPVLSYLYVPIIFLAALLNIAGDNKRAVIDKDNRLSDSNLNGGKYNSRLKQREIIHGIINHLESHYRDNYNRLDLAEKFRIHDNYMVQLFKKHTGATISGYINTLRIRASIELIKKEDAKIVDIAYHVGFNNLTYFYRAFKKHTGMTPNEYRSRILSREPDLVVREK